ncbi:hypothetical protein GCM10010191_78490 [Actinomadura vinacea]|uniref:Uncharacterized protein n=1 Tax=Actinomadura vinacea TaxID=115336 RepID=A0ABN3K5B2_9ACTN
MGGGILASVVANELPAALRWNRDLYVLPALVGAGTVALLSAMGVLDVVTASVAVIVALVIRLLALRYRWHTLRAYVWRNPFAGMRQVPAPQEPIPVPGAWPVYDEQPTLQFGSPVPSAGSRFPEPGRTHTQPAVQPGNSVPPAAPDGRLVAPLDAAGVSPAPVGFPDLREARPNTAVPPRPVPDGAPEFRDPGSGRTDRAS